MMDRWAGKVAVVSGASSGIGAVLSQRLVELGLLVVGIARRIELIEDLAQKLSSARGKLYPLKADFTKQEEIVRAFNWVRTNVGPVSILVNNAGTLIEGPLTVGGHPEDWKTVLDLNVFGLCVATKEAVEMMKEHGINGHIVHVNSIAGHKVPNFPNTNVYAASKYAVTALTETLRFELQKLGTKIKVSSVSPGLTESELTTLNPNYSADRMAMIKSRPILKAEDVVDAIIYVLSTPEHVQVHELTIKPVGEPI